MAQVESNHPQTVCDHRAISHDATSVQYRIREPDSVVVDGLRCTCHYRRLVGTSSVPLSYPEGADHTPDTADVILLNRRTPRSQGDSCLADCWQPLQPLPTPHHHPCGLPRGTVTLSGHPVAVVIGGLYVQSSQFTAVLSRSVIRCPIP